MFLGKNRFVGFDGIDAARDYCRCLYLHISCDDLRNGLMYYKSVHVRSAHNLHGFSALCIITKLKHSANSILKH